MAVDSQALHASALGDGTHRGIARAELLMQRHGGADDALAGFRLLDRALLLGLLTGFALPMLENPRMGLASHLEGVLNGLLLLILGVLWPRLLLSPRQARLTMGLVVYGTFANWAATLLAAVWGAGRSMPLAAAGHQGLAWHEGVLDLLLFSLSFAMLTVCGLILWGLRGSGQGSSEQRRTPSSTKVSQVP
jgi:hydroxylaminobenzene mutase